MVALPTSPTPRRQKVTCKVYNDGRPSEALTDYTQIDKVLLQPGTLVWFDVVDPSEEDLAVLQEEFKLHPLAIEDAIHAHQRPKIESYGEYWFLVVIATTLERDAIVLHEISIFANRNFLVTVRHEPAYPLEEIEARWNAHPERLRRGGGFLLYTILDTVVDGYLPVAQYFEDRVDDLEAMLFSTSHDASSVLPEIFQMKRDAREFRWAALPMRDILNPLIRGDVDLFPPEEIAYYRDVYDHAVRVIDQLDTLRDLVNSALEIHLSVIANRQAEVAKQLTLIATIFLPLSFIVGFFGQNFAFLVNHIGSTTSFWFLGIGTEAVVIAFTLIYFKKQGWF